MPLAPGTRLGPYEILAAIGAGGMGEVYKAKDTRLERVVALKVIQSAFAANPEMRERFEREARAISSLDHPHICILHDVCRLRVEDASAGQGRGDEVSFLVMQYLEGETLADRLARAGKPLSDPSRPGSGGDATLATISRGPMPFDTALKHAAEIAEALDAAHRRGIVHRDLKPGNVMLTKTGTKLLDFGLAKLAANEAGVGGFGGGDGATRTSPLTSQGALLGTLQYMSPEQLEGRDVDARSDIHAFGALLFEMVSGRRAFDAQSQAGIITAIVGGDPPSVAQLADPRTSLPVVARRALDRVLAKCLAKNPDERWQSAADLADELRWIVEERQRAVPETTAGPAAPAPPASRTRERIGLGVAAASLVALAVVAYAWYPRTAPPPGPVTFTIAAPPGQQMSTGPGLVAVSPDGSAVAFVTGSGPTSQLWVRRAGSLEPERLERGDGAWHPVWSPDGKAILISQNRGTGSALVRIDLAGGPARTLVEQMSGRAAWSSAGVILYVGADRKLYRIPENGGTPALALDLDASQETSIDWPMFLPDGRRYLFTTRGPDPAKTGVFLASLDSPGRTFLLNLQSSLEYADGHLFYHRDGTLMAHPFDADAGRLLGDAVPVVEDVRYNVGNGRAAFSMATTAGALAYVSGSGLNDQERHRLVLFDRAGKPVQEFAKPGRYQGATLSPNGRQAIVTQDAGQPPVRSLWLLDLERDVMSQFTVGQAEERTPLWSPDGGSIVFQSLRDKARGIYRRMAGGGATSDELLFSGDATATSFSSDGQRLLMTVGIADQMRVWVLPLTGDRKPLEAFPGAVAARTYAAFSPDDKWIAYSQFTGALDVDIFIEPHPADGRRVKVSTAGGRHARWTADGRRLIYRASDNTIMSVDLTHVGGMIRPSAPVALFQKRRAGVGNWVFSMDPKGDRFLLVQPPENEADATPAPITVVMNFVQSLQKK